MFVWHCLPRVSLGGSVGVIFFLNIYSLHMDGNGKKKNLRFGKKNFLVAAKQVSRSAMPNKPFLIFGPMVRPLCLNIRSHRSIFLLAHIVVWAFQ